MNYLICVVLFFCVLSVLIVVFVQIIGYLVMWVDVCVDLIQVECDGLLLMLNMDYLLSVQMIVCNCELYVIVYGDWYLVMIVMLVVVLIVSV